MKTTLLTAALVATLAAPVAMANPFQEFSGNMPTFSFGDDSEFHIGGNVGTQGFGVEGGYRINSTFGIRGSHHWFDYEDTVDFQGSEVDASASLGFTGVMVDFYPFGGNLRLSGGAYKNASSGSASGEYTQAFDFNGYTYNPSSPTRIDAELDWEKEIAPAASIGYFGKLGNHISLGVELGAMFTGPAQVSATASGDPLVVSQLQPRIDTEIENIQNELDRIGVYPIAKVGLNIRF